ncbi:MAG: LexA family transcriptional regulator [Thermoprotei archaeon]|nr:MAG: LexA family transcriptional regulator [Thermoprotei archaeon]
MLARLKNILLRRTRRVARDPLLTLSGSSLQVYLILLTSKKPLGIREVQRRAGFKSPNSARHHLDKLIERGFAYRVDDGYVAVKPRGSLVSLFIIIRNIMFPKMFFYALASSLFLIAYVFLRIKSIDPFPLIFLLIITIMLWLDSIELMDKVNKLKRIGIRE